MSAQIANHTEDDKLEVLEFYIGLLQERVENFKKEKNVTRNQLNEFISEYIDLEDKILNLMEFISRNKNINVPTMVELTNIFNKYWAEYQDEWNEDYWELYNMYRHVNDKDVNMVQHVNHVNKKTLTVGDSFLDESYNNGRIRKGSEVSFKDLGIYKRTPKHLREKTGSTNDESFNITTINLNKIDEEMREFQEFSIIKDRKDEKRRTCLDCVIF